jgi:hypothetical protein
MRKKVDESLNIDLQEETKIILVLPTLPNNAPFKAFVHNCIWVFRCFALPMTMIKLFCVEVLRKIVINFVFSKDKIL